MGFGKKPLQVVNMVYRIYLTGAAIQDIDDAYEWYGTKAADLEKKFAIDLQESFQKISQYPDAFAKRYKEVRGKLMKKFPYLILYRTNNANRSIEVLRVFNTWQKPYWD